METDEVIGSLSRELRPVRRLPRAEVRATRWALLAAASVAAGTVLLGPRHDLLSRMRDPQFLLQNAVLLLVFLICDRVAFDLSVPGSEGTAAARALPFWGVLIWGVMLTSLDAASFAVFPAGWRCVTRMASLAVVPSALAFSMLRKAAPLEPGWTGCFAFLGVASIATSGMQMICPRADATHALWWHLVPVLVFAAAGARLGAWLLRRA
jgi:hypothetical protein